MMSFRVIFCFLLLTSTSVVAVAQDWKLERYSGQVFDEQKTYSMKILFDGNEVVLKRNAIVTGETKTTRNETENDDVIYEPLIPVSRLQIFGTLTRLENLVRSTDDTQKAITALSNLYSERNEVLQEIAAMREILRGCK